LSRSRKVQEKASEIGFGFKDILGAFFKIKEETHKLQIAYQSCDRQNMADELGDLLFSVVNTARFIRVDPKECLSMATDKFIKKFEFMEMSASARGQDLKALELSEFDQLWEKAKDHGISDE